MKMMMENEPIMEVKKGNGYKGATLGREGEMHKAMIEYMVESEDEDSCMLRVMSIEKPDKEKPKDSGDAFAMKMREQGNY